MSAITQREVTHKITPPTMHDPTPRRTERHVWIAAGACVLTIMSSYGIVRLVDRTQETLASIEVAIPDMGGGFPWGAVALVAALLLLRVAFKAGKYARGYQHARGIRKSHWAAISGRSHH